MPKLIMMVGVPGAGKGHWIKNNGPENAVVCSADHHFYELGNGSYAFDPSQLGTAHAKCQAKCIAEMNKRTDCVVIDNTNLHAKHMKPYIEAAEDHGYETEIVRITPKNGFTAFQRNLHGLPEDAHKRMQAQFVKRDLPKGIKVVEVYED